jgi:hypothetical protein
MNMSMNMNAYLASGQLNNENGNFADQLTGMWPDSNRVGLIANARDFDDPQAREASVNQQMGQLVLAGLDPIEVDLRKHRDTTNHNVVDFFRKNRLGGLYACGGHTLALRYAFGISELDENMGPLFDE